MSCDHHGQNNCNSQYYPDNHQSMLKFVKMSLKHTETLVKNKQS